jgi:hypothetical protein
MGLGNMPWEETGIVSSVERTGKIPFAHVTTVGVVMYIGL